MAVVYVKNKDLLVEILISKEQDYLTPKAEKMFIMMADRIGRRFKYYNEDDRFDCQQGALLMIFANWRSFNTAYKNPFSYYTEILKRGYAASFNQLRLRKGQDKNNIPKHYSLSGGNGGDSDEGLFNI